MSDYEMNETTRLDRLEAKQAHTDSEVSAVRTQVDILVQGFQRVEQAILNKPPVWNSNSILALLGFCATIVGGGGLYMESQMNHVRDDINENYKKITVSEEFRHQAHYEFGVLHSTSEQVEEEVSRLWDHIHKLEDTDTLLRERTAAAEVSRKAIGNYVKEKHAGETP